MIHWNFVLIPFILQTLVIGLDEYLFHIKRGLPRWERIGHPLDTLSVMICLLYVYFVPFSSSTLSGFVFLCILSCLLVTKDEFIHKEHCPASEQWLHAILFLNHPIMLGCLGFIWPIVSKKNIPSWLNHWQSAFFIFRLFLIVQSSLIFLFFLYQVVYWNFIYEEKSTENQ